MKITIIIKSFNEVFLNKNLMKSLRELTLDKKSGLNYELNNLEKISQNRKANAKIILAYDENKIIGWALLSREYSKFNFPNGAPGFAPDQGSLFEVFVSRPYRRKGVATNLFKVARKNAGPYKIAICPWNDSSFSFFEKLKSYKTFCL